MTFLNILVIALFGGAAGFALCALLAADRIAKLNDELVYSRRKLLHERLCNNPPMRRALQAFIEAVDIGYVVPASPEDAKAFNATVEQGRMALEGRYRPPPSGVFADPRD